MNSLKEMGKKEISKKKDQYKQIADGIQKVIEDAGLKNDEGGYELAKSWLINNELMDKKYLIKYLVENQRYQMVSQCFVHFYWAC